MPIFIVTTVASQARAPRAPSCGWLVGVAPIDDLDYKTLTDRPEPRAPRAGPAQETGWPAGDREQHLPTVSLPPAKERANHRQSKEQHNRKLREESDSTLI